MKSITTCLLFLAFVAGCATQQYGQAIAKVNSEIEAFNREPRNMDPLKQRVARIEFSESGDRAICFDKKGKAFLELEKQPDGRFKGKLSAEAVPFDSEHDGQWFMSSEFIVEKEMF
jgi:hypothetical protein